LLDDIGLKGVQKANTLDEVIIVYPELQ